MIDDKLRIHCDVCGRYLGTGGQNYIAMWESTVVVCSDACERVRNINPLPYPDLPKYANFGQD